MINIRLTRQITSAFLLVVITACSVAMAAQRGITNTSSSPYAKLRCVDMDDVRWTEGLWAERFQRCRTATIPGMRKALKIQKNGAQLINFKTAAGLVSGEHRGAPWGDGDCYKWLESMAHMYAITKDKKLDQLMDKWIEIIAKAQEPDGYISTNIQLTSKGRFQNYFHHELYNMGHLIMAGCIHRRATGKDNFLAIARKAGDCLYKEFHRQTSKSIQFGFNPSQIMALAELYRTTRDERYLELAGIFVNNRGSAPSKGHGRSSGTDMNQDRVPLRQERHAVGHAVCGTYLWCGAADVYAETGELALLESLKRIWRSAIHRRMHITGGVGAFHHKRSALGDGMSECFGEDYQLPLDEAYCETCSNIGNAMWNWRMLGLTGDAQYADIIEKVIYNTLVASVNPECNRYFYSNPVFWDGREVFVDDKGRKSANRTGQRWETLACYCCPPSVARTLAKLHGWVYSVSDEDVWIHIYGGNKLETELSDGFSIGLSQKTNYPWAGQIQITVDKAPAKPFGIMLRIPGWAEKATVKINGRKIAEQVKPGSYQALRRSWIKGDLIELNLPMPVRLMEAHPAAKSQHNRVAVMRGPVVYCLELPLRQDGAQIYKNGVFLPENIKFQSQFNHDFLGGMVLLKGRALTTEGKKEFVRHTNQVPLPNQAKWRDDVLYRKMTVRNLDYQPKNGTLDITLIPYFAWANRGLSYMEVWIPLARKCQ